MNYAVTNQMTKLLPKVQRDWLIGFAPPGPGDMSHDCIIREFAHESLLG